MTKTIDILLATFNGDKYLREQLDSIIGQSIKSWQLIIRDDGSTDGTLAIINEYVARYPEKILLIDSGGPNLGTVGNFSRLLDISTADYIMFCDQDDIWLADKIAITLDKMGTLENCYGNDTPLMVYTDLQIVDEDSHPIAASMWRYQQLNPCNGKRLNRLLMHNIPTGCTMMLNRPLHKLVTPIPNAAYMHDWWIALVAILFGESDFVEQPTVLYRQHGLNVVGAESFSLRREACRFLMHEERIEVTRKRDALLAKYRTQASAIIDRFSNNLSSDDRTMIETFANMNNFSLLKQKYFILKYRFFYSNPLITAGMILFRW